VHLVIQQLPLALLAIQPAETPGTTQRKTCTVSEYSKHTHLVIHLLQLLLALLAIKPAQTHGTL
jgi:hypothetical protein